MFGQSKEGFCPEKLTNLIYEQKIEEAKTYILNYFLRLGYPDVGVMMWVPFTNSIQFYKNADIKASFLPDVKIKQFDLHKWFFNEITDIYLQEIDNETPRIYQKDGNKIINLFAGYLHKERREYSKETMKKVNTIWNHINNVWCSGNEEQYQYVKKWIANMVSGRKMQTALYLKSGQGTGKSMILEFLEGKVLGPRIVTISSNPESVLGNFNDQIAGKVLLILEELPCVTTGQWNDYSNKLKHLITGSTIEKREKFKSNVQCKNIISLIIATNNDAIRIDTDDRRYVIVDISNSKVGNREYFNELANCVKDKEVGEAFYWNCIEIAKEKYEEWTIPVTNSKVDLILNNIHSVFSFIKEAYLADEQGLQLSFKDFYDSYNGYVADKKLKPVTKISVSKILTSNGIECKVGTGNKRVFDIKFEELYKIFEKKKWIHETDDIIKIEQPNEDKEFFQYVCKYNHEAEHKQLVKEARRFDQLYQKTQITQHLTDHSDVQEVINLFSED